VTIQLPEEQAGALPAERPAKRARKISCHRCVLVTPDHIVVGIMRLGVSTPSASVIRQRKEFRFLFGHHDTYWPRQ